MSADIVNKDFEKLCFAQWAKAFSKDEEEDTKQDHRDDVNRKATIVIEHIILTGAVKISAQMRTRKKSF